MSSSARADARVGNDAGVAELVDAADSKSAGSDIVRVRVPSPAPSLSPHSFLTMTNDPSGTALTLSDFDYALPPDLIAPR